LFQFVKKKKQRNFVRKRKKTAATRGRADLLWLLGERSFNDRGLDDLRDVDPSFTNGTVRVDGSDIPERSLAALVVTEIS